MNRKKAVWSFFTLTAIIWFGIAVLFLMIGCAAPVPLNAEECKVVVHVAPESEETCLKAAIDYENEQYERENRRLVRDEETKAFIKACLNHPSAVPMYTCRVCSYGELRKYNRSLSAWRRGKGDIHLPRGSRRIDFQCVSTRDGLGF